MRESNKLFDILYCRWKIFAQNIEDCKPEEFLPKEHIKTNVREIGEMFEQLNSVFIDEYLDERFIDMGDNL